MKKPTKASHGPKMAELRTVEIRVGEKSEWAIISADPQHPLTEEEAKKIVQQLSRSRHENEHTE